MGSGLEQTGHEVAPRQQQPNEKVQEHRVGVGGDQAIRVSVMSAQSLERTPGYRDGDQSNQPVGAAETGQGILLERNEHLG